MATPFLDGLMAALREARTQVAPDRAAQRRAFMQQQPVPTAAPAAAPPPQLAPAVPYATNINGQIVGDPNVGRVTSAPTPAPAPMQGPPIPQVPYATNVNGQIMGDPSVGRVNAQPLPPLPTGPVQGPPIPQAPVATVINGQMVGAPAAGAGGLFGAMPPRPVPVGTVPGAPVATPVVPQIPYATNINGQLAGDASVGRYSAAPTPAPQTAGGAIIDRPAADTGAGATAPPVFTKDTPGVSLSSDGTPYVTDVTPQLLAGLPKDVRDANSTLVTTTEALQQKQAAGTLTPDEAKTLDADQNRLIQVLNAEQKNRQDFYLQRMGLKQDPLMQLLHDPVGAVKSGVGTVLGAVDKPRQEIVSLEGDLIYQAAKNGALPDWAVQANSWLGKLTMPMGTPMNDMLVWQQKNPQAVIDAYEKGYNGFKGGRAVWELYQSQQNMAQRGVNDILSDPLNLLPAAGAIGKAEDATRLAKVVGGLGDVANKAVNLPADLIFKGGGGLLRDANVAAAEKLGRGAKEIPNVTPEQLMKTPLGEAKGLVDLGIRTRAREAADKVLRAKNLEAQAGAQARAVSAPEQVAGAVPVPTASEPKQARLIETNPKTGELRITEAAAGTPQTAAPIDQTARPRVYLREPTTDTGTRITDSAVRDTKDGGLVFDAPPSVTPQEVVVQDASGARSVREVAPSEEPTPVVLTPDEIKPNPTHTAPDYQATTPNAIPKAEKRYHKIVTQYGDTLGGQTDIFVEEVNKADDALHAAQAARGGTSPIDSARFNVAVEDAFHNAYAGTDATIPPYRFRNGRVFNPDTANKAAAVEHAVFNPDDAVATRARRWLHLHGYKDLATEAKTLRSERLAITDQTAARVPAAAEQIVAPSDRALAVTDQPGTAGGAAPGGANADLVTVPRVTPEGQRTIYIGRTVDDTPVRIVERFRDGEPVTTLEYARPNFYRLDGKLHAVNEWLITDRADIRAAITGQPPDYMATARQLLDDVDRLRAKEAAGTGVPYPTLSPNEDMAQQSGMIAERQHVSYPDAVDTTARPAAQAPPPAPAVAAQAAPADVLANPAVEDVIDRAARASRLGTTGNSAINPVGTEEFSPGKWGIYESKFGGSRDHLPIGPYASKADAVAVVRQINDEARRRNFALPLEQRTYLTDMRNGVSTPFDQMPPHIQQVERDQYGAFVRQNPPPADQTLGAPAPAAPAPPPAAPAAAPSPAPTIATQPVEPGLPQMERRAIVAPEDRAILDQTFQTHDRLKGQTYGGVMDTMRREVGQDARDKAAIQNLPGPISTAQQKLLDRLEVKYGALGDLTVQEADLNGRLHWVPNRNYDVQSYLHGSFDQAMLKELGYQGPGRLGRFYDRRVIGTFTKFRLLAPWNFIKYLMGNVIGDSTQTLIAGKGMGAFNRIAETKATMKLAFTRDYTMMDSPMGELAVKTGRPIDPGFFHGNLTEATVGEDVARRLRRVRGKTQDNWISKGIRTLNQTAANINNGFEWGGRAGLARFQYEVEYAARRSDLAERAQVMARFPGSRGWDGLDGADIKAVIDGLDTVFSPEDVRQAIEQYGAAKGLPARKVAGYAEQVGRQWASIQHEIDDKVISEVNRVLFDYKYTNLDEVLKRVVPFHFWATRALPFYVEQGMRHPGLMAAYFRMSDGMVRANQNADIPPWLKNQIGFWHTPAGYALYWNPLAAIGVISLMDQSSGDTAIKGETVFGKIVREARDTTGVTLYPWFLSMGNTFGLMGDTINGLDPFGTSKDRKFFGSILQYFGEQGWLGPNAQHLMGKPFEQYLIDFRAKVSGAVGINPIAATDANNSPRVQLMTLIMEDIRKRDGLASGQPLDDAQLQEANDALGDSSNPLYKKALHAYATENLRLNSTNLVVPGYIQRTLTAQTQTANLAYNTPAIAPPVKGDYSALWRPTDPYSDGQITPDEQAWLDQWKQTTGKEYKPGDLVAYADRAKLTQDIATGTPVHNKLALALAEEKHLGTDTQQVVYQTWNGIAYSTPIAPVTILGHTWQPAEITALPTDQRLQLADQWTAGDPARYSDYQQVKTLRDAYVAAHPELASYRDWSKQVNQYATKAQYRFDISRTNPNAARYFQQARQSFLQKNPTASPSEVEAHLDKITVTQASYEAVNGIQGSKTKPIATGPVVMTAPAAQQPGSGPMNPAKLQKDVLDYQQKVAQANAYLTQLYRFPVDVNTLPDGIVMQTALAQLPPGYLNGSSTARAYLRWAAQQQYLGQPSDPATYLAQQQQSAILPGMIPPPVTPPA